MATNILLQKLSAYKKKYYRNQLIRGILLGGGLLLTAYLCVNTLEFFGRFSPGVRASLFFSFVVLSAYVGYRFLLDPILKLNNLNHPISNEEAARQVGHYFKGIDDKLLNTLQLQNAGTPGNPLLLASIEQRTQQLSVVPFTEAVDLRQNRRHLRFLIPPLLLVVLISATFPRFFTESSRRLVNFHRVYLPEAPFQFDLANRSLRVFRNEDLTVTVKLTGNSLPDAVYLNANGRKHKMSATDARTFSFTFLKIQKPFAFEFEAAGFSSQVHGVSLIARPSLRLFSASLHYPPYLRRVDEQLSNVGNLLVPEGTQIEWVFESADTDSLLVLFGKQPSPVAAQPSGNGRFAFTSQARHSQHYQVKLKNKFGHNKEDINYYLDVIPDQFPKVALESFKDTTLYNYLIFGGDIADDYGFSKLAVVYTVLSDGEENRANRNGVLPLPFQPRQTTQNYYYQWPLDKLQLLPGDKVQYYVQVWDNDGVNGPKSSKSPIFTFAVPSEQELDENQDVLAKRTTVGMGDALTKASRLKKEIESLEDRLKTKKQLDFQDKKQIEEVLKKRDELNQELQQLQQQMKSLAEQQNRFSENNPQLTEKMEQLQKLMDALLDEETKKLYNELQKLLETNKHNQPLLDKISQKENTLEKEIERTLEMFKQLQFEQKLNKEVSDLKEMADEQKKLAEKTEQQPKADAPQPELQQQQQELNEKFEEQKQDMKELEQLNKEMEQPNSLDKEKQQQLEQEVTDKQQQSLDQLKKEQNKKAAQNQKEAAQKMEQMAKEMEQMMDGMEMEQSQENLDDLRDILENLLTLSFDQERVMKEFRTVSLADPRFQKLAQEQLKLKDDARIIEDSLYSLAKRVFQIESFVTREVTDMKQHMDESSRGIKERRISMATAEQQSAMTSMNNLALMLNDALKQMQEQMAKAKQGKGKNKKPGKKQQPGLSQLQQQLNQRIQELQQSGKSGRQLSEELARMAAQQDLIRRALQEMEKQRNEKGEKPGGMEDILKKMEETEKDLVNKLLSPDMIRRNQDISTRLLEFEKAQRERDEDEKRKAEQAKQLPLSIPPSFEKYIRTKEKQIELLKTIPPTLSPYFRKEVDAYFKKLETR